MKHIILKVSHEKFKTLKSVLKEVKDLSPRVAISPVKQGNLGDDVMASFTVDDEHYQQIIEKLEKKDIRLVGNDAKKEKKQVLSVGLANHSTAQINQSTGNNAPIETKVVPKNDTPASILDAAIKNGDYEKVIQYSKDYRNGFEVLKRAKDNIDITIKNSIENTFNKAIKNKYDVSNSLTHLIKIASDKDLKNLHKNDQIKTAGLKAVELCSVYREYINILVQICNNNAMPHIVCIKAAIKLAYILGSEDEKLEENIDYVVRYLNLRWLNIAYYTASTEIPEKEKEIFKALVSTVKERFDNIDPLAQST